MTDGLKVATSTSDALRWATARLAEAGIEAPRWDAEQLASHALAVHKGELVRNPPMGAAQHSEFVSLVTRRAARVPLQHLTGSVGFRHLEVAVGPGVFIPRPESEVVAGHAIDALLRNEPSQRLVVELCAGSAVIALTIAQEVPDAQVHAVEIDDDALVWARRNAAARAAAGDPPITLHQGDVSVALPELDGLVDCVVANPPYVAEAALADVEPEVRDHDPHVALIAGADGLDVIRVVVDRSARLLRSGGVVVIEHGESQGDTAPAVLQGRAEWTDVRDHPDLAGRPRLVTAIRTSA